MRSSKVNHEMIINVETGAYTAKPPLDIHQGDANSHILVIKLRNNEDEPIQINECSTAKITFKRDDSTRVEIGTVEIVNPYRGVLSYTIGPSMVRVPGRYTCRLDVSSCCDCGCDCAPSATFVVNIAKDHNYDSTTTEVAISEEFYNDLQDHLNNSDIHINEIDRDFLDTFSGMTEELETLLNTDFDQKIDSRVFRQASAVLARAFITVDFESQLTALRREEVCEGKIVRVNYRNEYHDGDTSTIEDHSHIEFAPQYYVCKLIGDNETIEWHKLSFGSVISGEIAELTSKVNAFQVIFDEALARSNERLSIVEERQDELEIDVNQRFAELNEIVRGCQELISHYDERLTDVEDAIVEHTQTIAEHTEKIEYSLRWGAFTDIEGGGSSGG